MKISNAVIFAVGTWNGRTYTADDLDAIVDSFVALNLRGRVPLKFGHNDEQPLTDGQPALGWVERVKRDGDRLVADLDVLDSVAPLIQKGLYKFTSAELLLDATDQDGRTWQYVLDGLALIGVDRPAVDSVSDLRALAATRQMPALRFAKRVAFAVGASPEAALRAENARLVAELVALKFEEAIRDGRILPRDREAFNRRYGASATVADALAWISASPKAERFSRPSSRPTGDGAPAVDGRPDAQLVALTRRYLADNEVKHLQLTGERLTFDRAAQIVGRQLATENPSLLRAWILLPGER